MASLKANYIFSLLNTISGLLFPLITFPYVTRTLLPDGIGEVNFFLSIITYISMFTSLGIPIYALREIARDKDDPKQLSQTTVEVLALHLLLTIIGYIAVVVICLTVVKVKVNVPLFLLMSVNIIFNTIGCEWFFQGMEDFKYVTIRSLVVRIICVVLLFVLVRDSSDLLYYGLYSVLGVVGGNVFNFIHLRKSVNVNIVNWKKLDLLRHLGPALRIFALNVIASIYLQLDTVMLGFMKDNNAVGYYTGAIRLTKMLMGITTSLGVVLLPRLTILATTRNLLEFKALLKKALDFVIVVGAPLSIGLFIMAPILIRVFCGENFIPSISTLEILSPIIFFISISYIFAQTIFSLGKENITIIVSCISASVNVVLNLMLIPRYAENGAGCATLFAECASMITYLFISRKLLGSVFILNKHSFQCFISVIVMSIVLWGIIRLPIPIFLSLFIIPVMGIITYCLSLSALRNKLLLESFIMIKNKIKN